MIQLNQQQFSRLLYTNPVCILTSNYEQENNMMIISWLTPINNSGDFVCSINKKRYTNILIEKSNHFILNVPTQGMEDLLLEIGKCSGEKVNKMKKFNFKYCGLGRNKDLDKDLPYSISECISHMYCMINKRIEIDEHHYLLYCSIKIAFVDQNYWKNNQFIPLNDSKPYLTFFGSQTFGYITKK